MEPELLHPNAAPFEHLTEGAYGAVLLHGWTGSPAHLRLLAADLMDDGHSVLVPLLAGHGTTLHEMLDTTWRDWLRSAAEAAQRILERGQRLHLVGLSMGGLLSVLLAPVFGAVSITTINTPMVAHDRRLRWSWVVRGSRRLVPYDQHVPPDPAAADYYRQYDASPIGKAADLYDLMRAAKATLRRVACPLLVIQSRADETVRPESARIILDGVSSSTKRIVWLEEARHVALVDAERHVVHREVRALIAGVHGR